MNHISKGFSAGDGRVYRSHAWERHEGGYRRIALVVSGGARPIDQESRLLGFLLDRGFRVAALDLAYGAPLEPPSPRPGLRAFREAVAAFAAENEAPDLPLYIVASSFSAGAILPMAEVLPTAAAWALIAPVVEFPPPGLGRSSFLSASAALSVGPAELCGDPELLEGWADRPLVYKFRKKDLALAGSELASTLATGFDRPVAAFAGDADPFLSEAGRVSLRRFGAKLYGYPRAKHDPAHDRCADRLFADLGSFLDAAGSSA